MKTVGIICELNPAHQGHKYIFEKAKEITNADYIVVILSGNYVQRGEPAIFDKYIRTQMALEIGADLVIELPGLFATGSVEYFCRGAISILDRLNVIDYLVFGSECGDITTLNMTESTTPNDILGAGYIKALNYFNSKIKPIAIKRIGAGYNDIHLNASTENYPSALSIRNMIYNGEYNKVIANINNEITYPASINNVISINDFSNILLGKLLTESAIGYDKYFDIFTDLSNKIRQNLDNFQSVTQYTDLLKSKDIAYAHLKRALLHIILDYQKTDFDIVRDTYFSYARVLGFKKDSTALLNKIKKDSSVKIISKLADAYKSLSEESYSLLLKDINASHLYSYVESGKIKNEFKQNIVIM